MPAAPVSDPLRRLVDAALPHVAFDGWSDATLTAAAKDIGMTQDEARRHAPRGGLDLARAYHRMGDAAMRDALRGTNLSDLRYRDRVARAIRLRLDAITDKEAVRRASAMFALPHLAPEGARLIWETADAIWESLGDSSEDVNWYTKRATLSGVYAAVVLYWLGDNSPDQQATDAFIDRRIDDVMQIEKFKAQIRENPLTKPFAQGLGALTARIRKPMTMPGADLPGIWRDPR